MYPGSSRLAEIGLVPGPTVTISRTISRAASVLQAPQTASQSGLPQSAVIPQPTRLEIFSRHLQKHSQDTIELLLQASTNPNGRSSLIGVTDNRLTHSRSLFP